MQSSSSPPKSSKCEASPGGRVLSSVTAIFDSAERFKLRKESTLLQPRNLFEALMRASIEPSPIKNSLLEAASPLGNILNHPHAHPLSPLTNPRCSFNPRPLMRVLDAPALQDDYYLNVLDWNRHDQLVIALGSEVHWCSLDVSSSSSIGARQAQVTFREAVTGVRWTTDGENLLIGDKSGKVYALNCTAGRLKDLDNRKMRVGCIDTNTSLAVAGGRDRQAVLYDLRTFKRTNALLGGHQQEICGVRFSPDGSMLATGGNDNVVCVWDLRMGERPMLRLTEHLAAVKGLTWLNNSRLLTGGGTADRTLKLWDVTFPTASSLHTLQTGSQVTCLEASTMLPGVFYAAHGFSDNSLQTYKITEARGMTNGMTERGGIWRVKEQEAMTGHLQRVLWMVKRPVGLGEELLASASGDESIRIWRPLLSPKARPKRQRSFTDIIRSNDPEDYNVFNQ